MSGTIIRWRRKIRTGSHTFFYQGKKYRVKPGDTIEVPEHVLGSFVEKYERLGVVQGRVRASKSDSKTTPPEVKKETPKGLQLVDLGGGVYDVINPDRPNNPLNDEPLSLDDAQEFLEKLEGDE